MSWVFESSAATMRSVFVAVAMAILVWTLVERVRMPTGRSKNLSAAAVEIPPEELLRTATVRVRPVYPPMALAARVEGVIVANVSVDVLSGTVKQVRILQSPSTECADTVRDAVAKWRFAFGNPPDAPPTVADGRIIFYFLIRSGIGQVFAADEAPNHATSFDVLTSEVR